MAAMEGYHSSVFLYGQTGTGKTYTMQVRYALIDIYSSFSAATMHVAGNELLMSDGDDIFV